MGVDSENAEEAPTEAITGGLEKIPFDWDDYLQKTHSSAAPKEAFCQPHDVPTNPFKVGHLLFTEDANSHLMVLAKVRYVYKCFIYVHIEGLDKANCRWMMCDDKHLSAIGPRDESEKYDMRGAQPPVGFKALSRFKTWIAQQYTEHAEDIADVSLFNMIDKKFLPKENHFRPGMKLAAYDGKAVAHDARCFDGRLRPATVVDIDKQNVTISFDGEKSYHVTLPFDSRCLFPIEFVKAAGFDIIVPVITDTLPEKEPKMVKRRDESYSSTSSTQSGTSDESGDGETPRKKRRLGFFSDATRPMRPSQRTAAYKEQVTGVKAKVIDILRIASEEQEREELNQPPLKPPVLQKEKTSPPVTVPMSVRTPLNVYGRPLQGVALVPSNSLTRKALHPEDGPNIIRADPTITSALQHTLFAERSLCSSGVERVLANTNTTSNPRPKFISTVGGGVPRTVNIQPVNRFSTVPIQSATATPSSGRLLQVRHLQDLSRTSLVPAPRIKYVLKSAGSHLSQNGKILRRVSPQTNEMTTKAPLVTAGVCLSAVNTKKRMSVEPFKSEIQFRTNGESAFVKLRVSRKCRVGPFLEAEKVRRLPNYSDQQPYPTLLCRLVQDLIYCAKNPREVFDLVKFFPSSAAGLKVTVLDEGAFLTKIVPIHQSVAGFLLYLREFLVNIGCCPNLIVKYDFACTDCAVDDDGEEIEKEVEEPPPKYRCEYTALKRMGAKLLNRDEVKEEYTKRMGEKIGQLVYDENFDGAVLPHVKEDLLRESLKLPYNVALRMTAIACELRAEAFESLPEARNGETTNSSS